MCENPVDETRRLIEVARQSNIVLRAIGGIAINLHAASIREPLRRDYADIDLVVSKKDGACLEKFLVSQGYVPDKSFNTYNGHERQLYYDTENNRQMDVFVGDFRMCHAIPLNDRLTVEEYTIPRAELLLTKIQIVEMNHKDVVDLYTLLLNNEITPGDNEGISWPRTGELCGSDWGLYKTVSLNSSKLIDLLPDFSLEKREQELIKERLEMLLRKVEEAPKNMKWKMRALIGEKMPWYELPEEVRR